MYPAVGLVIGGIVAPSALWFERTGASLGAALVLALWVAVSGGLHLEGLADSADAWAGGADSRERGLAIMKDPHVGSFAVIALFMLLLVKYAALCELLAAREYLPLLLAPALGRAAVPALLLSTPYARDQGLGRPLIDHLPREAAACAVGLTAAVAVLGLGLGTLVATAVATWWLRALMQRRLGGCTGDTLGATIEIVEAAVLLTGALAGA